MRKFNLKLLNDADDACPEVLEVLKGATNPSRSQMQFLLKTVFWQGVTDISILKKYIRLTLSKSSQSPASSPRLFARR